MLISRLSDWAPFQLVSLFDTNDLLPAPGVDGGSKVFRIILIHRCKCLSSASCFSTTLYASRMECYLILTISCTNVFTIRMPMSSLEVFLSWSIEMRQRWITSRTRSISSSEITFSRILLNLSRHLIISPGSFGCAALSLYLRKRLNRTQKMLVLLQFSRQRSIEPFKFFKMKSPSFSSPSLSRLSIKRRVRSYSPKSYNSCSRTTDMIVGHWQVLLTIVTKYLAKRKGVSYLGLSKMSMST